MKKQELIHLHGLLAEICNYCETSKGISIELDEYLALDTRPTSIHKSKTDHKNAVFALSTDVTSTLVDEQVETVSANAD